MPDTRLQHLLYVIWKQRHMYFIATKFSCMPIVDRHVGLACFSPLIYTMIFNDLTPKILMSTFQHVQ